MPQTSFLHTAISAALEAGKVILDIYDSDGFEVTLKDDNSPLTKADIAAHNIIISYLKATNIPVLSEEGQSIPYNERKNWKQLWIVDPIDGTKEFIKRNGEFTVNIALIENHKPVLGVIFVPVSGDLYFSTFYPNEGRSTSHRLLSEVKAGLLSQVEAGLLSQVEAGLLSQVEARLLSQVEASTSGSFKVNVDLKAYNIGALMANAVKLPLPRADNTFTILASRSHSSKETEAFIATLREKHGTINLISKGSSLKFCLIAEGQADCYPKFGPTMEWDTAAGQAICEQAGVDVIDLETQKSIIYNREVLLNTSFLVQKQMPF